MSEVVSILEQMLDNEFQAAVPRARQLSIDHFPELQQLIETSEDHHRRKLCYWMLTHLAVSTRSPKIGAFAGQRSTIESKVDLKLEALSITKFTYGIKDSSDFESELAHKNKKVQLEALAALGACTGRSAERALLKELHRSNNPTEQFESARSLARMCGPMAAPQFHELFTQLPRKKSHQSILASLVFAMNRHPSEESNALVRNELESIRLWQLGWACLHYLSKVADASDEQRIVRYCNRIQSRMKRGSQVYDYRINFLRDLPPTEICAALEASQRVDDSLTESLIDLFVPLWQELSSHDHKWIAANYPQKVAASS